MGNILTLLGICLVGAGTVVNIFAENKKPAAKKEVKTEDEKIVEVKVQDDPGAAAAGLK